MTVDRRPLIGLLVAKVVSLSGTRLSMIALPWFVLVTTGSSARTGVVALCELLPYVIVTALGGPVIDWVGPRRISVAADAASTGIVLAIPLLHGAGLLGFRTLLVLVAAAGAARGPGDAAKTALTPHIAEASGVPLERVTGLNGTIDRLSQTAGPLLAGVVVAWQGPLAALVIDAGTFLVAAVVISATLAPTERMVDRADAGYLRQLRAGIDFVRRDRLVRSIIAMIAITNTIDVAVATVLLPVWAFQFGGGPAVIGLLGAAMGATAVAGSAIATGIAHHLPRRATYLVGFLICGAPRLAVLTLDVPIVLVVVVWGVAGLGSGFINPILSAVLYERVPRPMVGRVTALAGTMAFAGTPFGGPAAGVLIALAGLSPAILACAAVYFAATMLPALRPEWRNLDGRPTGDQAASETTTAAMAEVAENPASDEATGAT
jgi:MFS family permease